jgi:hypothetical protein
MTKTAKPSRRGLMQDHIVWSCHRRKAHFAIVVLKVLA